MASTSWKTSSSPREKALVQRHHHHLALLPSRNAGVMLKNKLITKKKALLLPACTLLRVPQRNRRLSRNPLQVGHDPVPFISLEYVTDLTLLETNVPNLKLAKHVDLLAQMGKLTQADFQCTHCGSEMNEARKPRMVTSCMHLYCKDCVKVAKDKTPSGTKPICMRKGCGKNVGVPSIVQATEILQLKVKFLDVHGGPDVEMDDSDDESASDSIKLGKNHDSVRNSSLKSVSEMTDDEDDY